MKVLRAYKTELDLNHQQKTACVRHAGAARFAYNWGLARKQEAFARGDIPPCPSKVSIWYRSPIFFPTQNCSI